MVDAYEKCLGCGLRDDRVQLGLCDQCFEKMEMDEWVTVRGKVNTMIINDNHRNAVVGKLLEVANRSWGDKRRMVVIKTEDPFTPITVRAFVHNWEDAELLVDTMVVIYDDMVFRLGMGM